MHHHGASLSEQCRHASVGLAQARSSAQTRPNQQAYYRSEMIFNLCQSFSAIRQHLRCVTTPGMSLMLF